MVKGILFVMSLVMPLVLGGCLRPSDDLMARQYTWEELNEKICSQPKQCAEMPDSIWFVDEGFIFSYSKDGWEKKYQDGFDAKEIINYKDLIVGLQLDGDIYISAQKEDGGPSWYSIGNRTLSIATDGVDLIALTKRNGEIWRYKGQPGRLIWTYLPMQIPMTTSCGPNCTTTTYMTMLIPTVAGRKIAFEKTEINGVSSFGERSDGGLVLHFSEGQEAEYGDLLK